MLALIVSIGQYSYCQQDIVPSCMELLLWCDNVIVCSYTGFLFVGTFPHPDLIALTQNISPLQADFNPGLNDTARVLVYSTGKYWCIAQDLPAS